MGPPRSSHKRKLRVLCLHGFRTSAKILAMQLAKWDRSVLDLLDMVFLDGPHPAEGKSDIEDVYPPPYYEWYQFEATETGVKCINLNQSIQSICDFMEMFGPFDGLVGFSQGATLSAALAGMQQQGLALTSVPALRFVIIISGGYLFGDHSCYSEPIRCPSLHIIGEKDFLRPFNEDLLPKFKDPIIIRHASHHIVPKLEGTAILPVVTFLEEAMAIRDQEDHSSD